MNTTTVNITLPMRLKREIENQVKSGMYTSVSEFIRHAVRRLLTAGDDIPYGPPFSKEAEQEILKSTREALVSRKKNIVLKTPEDIDRFFDSL